MAVQTADPWLAIGDPVAGETAPGNASHISQIPANDPYAAVADAASPQEAAPQQIGDIGIALPATPQSKLSPEDEQTYHTLLLHADAPAIVKFLSAKGFDPKQDIATWVSDRDSRVQKHQPIDANSYYEFPDVAKMADVPPDLTQGAGMAGARGALDDIPGINNLTAATRAIDAKLGLSGNGSTRSLSDEFAYQQDLGVGARQGDEEDHPWSRVAGQLFGSLAIPAGLEGVGLKAGTDVLRAGGDMAEARAAVKVAVRNRLAATSGGYGLAHGTLSADNVPDAITGGLAEGTLGAVSGAVLPALAPVAAKVGGAVARPFRSAADLATGNMGGRTANTALQPFVDEAVPALASDVGGTFSKMATGAANMTLGGIPLAQAARKSVEAAQQLKTAIADRIGMAARTRDGVSDTTGAGLAAQRGLRAVLGEDGAKQTVASKLYDAIPIAHDAPAVTSNTKGALAGLNEGLKSNPELSGLISDPRLLAYEKAFTEKVKDVPTGLLDASGNPITRQVSAGGKLSWNDLKNFRSYVGELAGRPTLQDSTSKGALQSLYAGLSEDMRSTAAAQGGNALSKFTRANTYYRALQSRRDEILKPLLGNKMDATGEDAFRQIERWSTQNGDVFALGRALRSLPDEEASTVRATIFDRLGTVTKGRQDGTGTVWSPNDFVTHWSGLSSRAKAVLFPGADYRQSIDNLVRIAASAKGAQAYANVSKTGNAVNGIALLTSFFTNPLATGAAAMGQLATGKLLASPRFAKWLGSAVSKPNPQAALAHVNRLSSIARAEPAIANEVLQLQQRLAEAFTPTRLAADQGSGVSAGGQPQEQQQEPEGALQ